MSSSPSLPPQWRRWDAVHTNIYTALCFLSIGALPLYGFYYPLFAQKIQTVESNPNDADCVIITIDGIEYVVDVNHFRSTLSKEHLAVIEVDCIRYVASSTSAYAFHRVPDVPIDFKRFCEPGYELVHDKKAVHEEYCILSAHYGLNEMKIPECSFMEVAVRHMLSPFYLFQYFAATVWYAELYWLYATLILIITFSAIYLTTQESIFNLQSLRMLAGSQNSVNLVNSRYDEIEGPSAPLDIESSPSGPQTVQTILDTHLVPGDKFIIQDCLVLPCDAVLISGKVVVDESMLTGESIPVSKVPIDLAGLGDLSSSVLATGNTAGLYPKPAGEVDLAMQRSGSVLFGGTKVKACYGEQCIAVCYRTSFRSSKGQLVASLLKPKEGFITFIKDALYVLMLMLIITSLLYCAVAVELVRMGLDAGQLLLHYLDAITIAVPPALTACLTVATAIAIARLKKQDIFVTDTSRVNFAGAISAACFDKTGTLTENTLQFLGALCSSSILTSAADNEEMVDFAADNQRQLPLICQQVMASCHSLTVLGTGDNTPEGDPLEVELLQACRWRLQVARQQSGQLLASPPASMDASTNNIIVLKHFEFTPDRLRAATLMKEDRSQKVVYLLKGSPEVIIRLSASHTVPASIWTELSRLGRQGYRVIAMAYRECKEAEEQLLSMTQEDIEGLGEVRFAGLLYLSSALKEDTTRTIQTLKHARIHTNMITGDHIHTAIAIGGQCKLVHNHEGNSSLYAMYIIDQDEATGELAILDHSTDQAVDMKLSEALLLAAKSMVRSMKKKMTSFSPEALHIPSTDTIDNPLLAASQSAIRVLSSASPQPPPTASIPVVELAITGKGLQVLKRTQSDATIRAVVRYAKIFARMKPHDKKYIVETLGQMKEFEPLELAEGAGAGGMDFQQSHVNASFASQATSPVQWVQSFMNAHTSIRLGSQTPPRESSGAGIGLDSINGYGLADDEIAVLASINNFEVLFCGDGANDMIALRAATVGVSLCDAETSVAAPITSKQQTPISVIEVLKQGRCSLITAYVLILFNIMYGVIQLFMACELYSFGLKAGDYMYLIQDLFYTLVLGLAISYSQASASLSATLPPQRFLSPYFLSKLALMLGTFIVFQVITLWALTTQHFYSRFETDDPLSSSYAYEASVANNMALAQLMMASIVSSIGEPFRINWTKNYYHWTALAFQTAWLMFQVFAQDNYFLKHVLEIKPVPTSFGGIMVLLMLLNLLCCLAISALIDSLFLAKANERWYEKLSPQLIARLFDTPNHVNGSANPSTRTPSTNIVASPLAYQHHADVEKADTTGTSKMDRRPLLKA